MLISLLPTEYSLRAREWPEESRKVDPNDSIEFHQIGDKADHFYWLDIGEVKRCYIVEERIHTRLPTVISCHNRARTPGRTSMSRGNTMLRTR